MSFLFYIIEYKYFLDDFHESLFQYSKTHIAEIAIYFWIEYTNYFLVGFFLYENRKVFSKETVRTIYKKK